MNAGGRKVSESDYRALVRRILETVEVDNAGRKW